MVAIRANEKKGMHHREANQIGRVFATTGKAQEQVQQEVAKVIFSHSKILSTWFSGKLTLKQRMVQKFGHDAGMQIYRLAQRNQIQGKALAAIKQQFTTLDKGSVCEACGTYHPQGTKNLVVDQSNRTFCNLGCKDQYEQNVKQDGELELSNED